MYSAIPGQINKISYYWIDPLTNKSVRKISFYTSFVNKNNEKGIIGAGVNVENLSKNVLIHNVKILGYPIIIFVSFLLFIMTIILFKISQKEKKNLLQTIKVYLFLILTNSYLLYFITKEESETTIINEQDKSSKINASVLNLSFLTGVIIFIIQSFYKKNRVLFKETALVFGVSIILLLFINYKPFTGLYVEDIFKERLTKQLFFNFCVIFNVIIIINFIIYSFNSK
jgi:hypothetical protein